MIDIDPIALRELFFFMVRLMFGDVYRLIITAVILLLAAWFIMGKSHQIDDIVHNFLTEIIFSFLVFGFLVLVNSGTIKIDLPSLFAI